MSGAGVDATDGRAGAHARGIAGEALLRCWVRETGADVPAAGGEWRATVGGRALCVPVTYRSPTGWHRFGAARTTGAGGDPGTPVDPATLAALIATAAGATADDRDDLVARVEDSTARIAVHHAERAAAPDDPAGTTPFLAAEQALLDGHPLHPTPKSRNGLGDAEAAAYSPERRGSFALHWFAADPDVVTHDDADPAGTPARLRALAPHLGLIREIPVPAHPWQARAVRDRPPIRALLADGRLRDLGPSGPPWYPTSSLRTVCRPGAGVMLKLPLGLRITNSRRENLPDELRRGAEVARLLDAGLADRLDPGFALLRDPAWLAVGPPGTGLDVIVRDDPFGEGNSDRGGNRTAGQCLGGLLAPGPYGAPSRLAATLTRLAATTGRAVSDVTVAWLARHLHAYVLPALRLHAHLGLAVESHLQNTLVRLDADGWPAGGWYRDNQGYYLARAGGDPLRELLPGLGASTDVDTDDALAAERLVYYLVGNHVLGTVGALGAQGLAPEPDLLAAVRTAFRDATDVPLAAAVLRAPTLRTKGNLLTRVRGLDELAGPVETQSVYVDVANPLHVPSVSRELP